MGVGGQADWLAALDPQSRAMILGVETIYLTTALEDLDVRFGGPEGFARERLGLTDESLDRLRGRLLG
jgi:protein-tyrosine phosphatase